MLYLPQQSDLDLLKQSARDTYVKIELLNKSFKVTGQVEGELISDSYSFDADSDIRRTCTLTLIVSDSSFFVGNDKKIWLDKYLRVYTGIYSILLHEIQWYEIGVFILANAGYRYDSATRTLTLSCEDRMSEFTGTRNGQVSGLATTIKAGVNIGDAIRETVTDLGGVVLCRVADIEKTVPYDLEFGTGSMVFDIIQELRDLYPGYETFFDGEYFICQPYPTCATDPLVLDAATLSPLIMSEDHGIDFATIKNVSEVWGICHETDDYTTEVTFSNGQYTADYGGSVTGLTDGYFLGFKANVNNTEAPTFKADALAPYPIIGEGNTPLPANKIEAGNSYVLKFVVTGATSCFYFCGQYQVCGVSKLVSREPTAEQKAAQLDNEPTKNVSWVVEPSSPFCCDIEGIGEIRAIYSGGEFDNIYSDELALQRAEYETWKSTDLQDTIILTLIDVPWLDVNQKIEYQAQTTGQKQTYIVKQKSGSTTGGTMTISCVKFQPLYSWLT